jgi:uncharacterized protein (DUF305 family)
MDSKLRAGGSRASSLSNARYGAYVFIHMSRATARLARTHLCWSLVALGCAARPAETGAAQEPGRTPPPARSDAPTRGYTDADVRFMQDMIAHHAQAVVMARWAGTHQARSDVKVLAERVDVSQRDEIALMQRWLRERRERVPEVEHALAGHAMPHNGALMPGMLSAAQLARLDSARGAAFDHLFLTSMIQHHQGALAMVRQLFAAPGAAQHSSVYRLASDIEADQSTEIDRMQRVLRTLPGSTPTQPSRP